jgi:thioester reductase-like protein
MIACSNGRDDAGGQSLFATELLTRIAAATGRRLTIKNLFETPTIAQLAAHLAGMNHSAASPSELNFLVTDIALDEDIASETVEPPCHRPEAIFITGATGFLGAFLTSELLRRSSARLICLVRARDEEAGRLRIAEAFGRYDIPLDGFEGRLEIACGDLAGGPHLGLKEPYYDDLRERVDVIFHVGAHVNFALPYGALRATNVAGTRNLVRFAAGPRPKPLHFTSTVAIFGAPRYATLPIIREDDPALFGADLYTGYQQSKWVGDRIAALAVERGLPVTIHRPANIGGHSVTGAWNHADYFLNLMIACTEAGVAPDVDFNLHFTPVDDLAAAIVALSSRAESLGKAFHLISPMVVRMSTILESIRSLGYAMRIVPQSRWRNELITRAESHPNDPLRPFLPLLLDSHDIVDLKFDSSNTTHGLQGTGVRCRPLDRNLLETYYRRYFREGLISRPPL